jgi:hypothetical protein
MDAELVSEGVELGAKLLAPRMNITDAQPMDRTSALSQGRDHSQKVLVSFPTGESRRKCKQVLPTRRGILLCEGL